LLNTSPSGVVSTSLGFPNYFTVPHPHPYKDVPFGTLKPIEKLSGIKITQESEFATVYFTAIIKSGKAGYGVYFPDLPGCVTAGQSVGEAARNAEAAPALHLTGMVEDGNARV
jgi:predicted RNase H-like HicB family nuclease